MVLSFLFGLLATTLASSLTFWRDFAIVRERQMHVLERLTRHERVMEDQAANIQTQQSLNAEQQFQLNQCLSDVREIRRLLRFDPGYP